MIRLGCIRILSTGITYLSPADVHTMFVYFMQSPSPASKEGWQPTRFWIRRAPQGKNSSKNSSPRANLSMKLFFHDIFRIPLSRLQHSHSLLSARRVYGTLMASSFKLINFQLKYFAGLLTYLLVALKSEVAESLHIRHVALTLRKCATLMLDPL